MMFVFEETKVVFLISDFECSISDLFLAVDEWRMPMIALIF